MPQTLEVPIDQRIDFPQRCARCGAVPTSTWPCMAKRGVDLNLFTFGRTSDISIPVCTQCWTIRRAVSSLAMILLSIGSLVAVGFLLPWLDGEGLIGFWLGLMV